MRHKVSGNKLGRNSSLRKATVRDIAKATLIEERICTTKAKAREARKLVDKLITMGKKGTLAHKRRAFSILCNHRLVKELFDNITPRFLKRAGGYTRIIPMSYRKGDCAQLVFLELTEKSEVKISKPKSSSKAKIKETLKEIDQKETKKAAEKTEITEIDREGRKTLVKAKAPLKKSHPTEKGKPGKKIVGSIKKMFRRKTAE